jgi:Na+/H+ antiporter NhaD/arsenite permease-like protein
VWVAVVIFALTYIAIAGRRLRILPVGRPAAGLFGAAACVAFGVLSPSQAYAAIDGDTIILLLAMMILAAHLDHAGFFEWGAAQALRYARTPQRLLTWVVAGAGIASAFLVNDSVCLMMTPLVVKLIRRGRLGPTLFLMALATSANIGSVMTFVGNPQNMIVGSLSEIPFSTYFILMAPLGIVCLAINRILLPWFYPLRPPPLADDAERAEWLGTPFDDADELPVDFRYTLVPAVRRALLVKCLVCLGLAIAGFFAGFNIAWTALVAATLLLMVAGWEPRQAFRHVDWPLLLFFAGLFIVVGGLRQAGAVRALFAAVEPLLSGGHPREGWSLAAVTVLGSNLFSNVPWVLAVADWMPQLVAPRAAWLILAMASTFAGNLTLIGSVANVLVIEGGRDVARVGFGTYLKYGMVITAVTTILGAAWILWVV